MKDLSATKAVMETVHLGIAPLGSCFPSEVFGFLESREFLVKGVSMTNVVVYEPDSSESEAEVIL